MYNNWWDYTDGSSCLMHYGVKGMKWGRRKQPQYTSEDLKFLDEYGQIKNRNTKAARRLVTAFGAVSGGLSGAAAGARYGRNGAVLGALGGSALGGAMTNAGYRAGTALGRKIPDHVQRRVNARYDRVTGRPTRALTSDDREYRNMALDATRGALGGAVGSAVSIARGKRRRNSGGRTTNYNY